MHSEKAAMLQQYLDITTKLSDAFVNGRLDEVPILLKERDELISKVDQLDHDAGTILQSPTIRELLTEVMTLEKDIAKHFSATLARLTNRIHFTKNEQYLSKQYEETAPISKGIFYDQKK